eukprot:781173-Prorocentrum_minimum.AAC.2
MSAGSTSARLARAAPAWPGGSAPPAPPQPLIPRWLPPQPLMPAASWPARSVFCGARSSHSGVGTGSGLSVDWPAVDCLFAAAVGPPPPPPPSTTIERGCAGVPFLRGGVLLEEVSAGSAGELGMPECSDDESAAAEGESTAGEGESTAGEGEFAAGEGELAARADREGESIE